jgi:peptidoglycan/LPS O-acetylase OafA/YrhL
VSATPTPTPTLTPPRLHSLDALRGFAMLAGIVWHAVLFCAVITTAYRTAPEAVREAVQTFLIGTHSFRLTLFFMIAGFFSALLVERIGERRFIRHRAERIALPLVVGIVTIVPLDNVLLDWTRDRAHVASGGETTKGHLHHLWFLWHLVLYYAVALALRRIPAARKLVAGIVAGTPRLLASPLALPALALAAAVLLLPSQRWGPQSSSDLLPSLGAFVYYLAPFAFGWVVRRAGMPALRGLEGNPAIHFAIAIAAAYGVVKLLPPITDRGAFAMTPRHLAVVGLTGLACWSAIFACFGLAARVTERAWVRYLSDASYWMYLVHVPLLIAMQGTVLIEQPPLLVSLTVPLAITVVVSLVTYKYLVRHTVIGRTLHGRR